MELYVRPAQHKKGGDMKRKKRIHIDIETYSESDIKVVGVAKQLEDPTTEVIFVGYKIHTGPTKMWSPVYG